MAWVQRRDVGCRGGEGREHATGYAGERLELGRGHVLEEEVPDLGDVRGGVEADYVVAVLGDFYEKPPLIVGARDFAHQLAATHAGDVVGGSTLLPAQFATQVENSPSSVGGVTEAGEHEVVRVREAAGGQTAIQFGPDLELHERQALPRGQFFGIQPRGIVHDSSVGYIVDVSTIDAVERRPVTIPATFIGHGSPMNTLEQNRYTRAWSEFAAKQPVPQAILAISAHWYINASAVTSMTHPRVIHDFYGFPQELFDFDYDAPGSPEVARRVAEIAQPTTVILDDDTWGIDHGTWSVLAHMYPEANVPVVQLSIDASKDIDYHVELGAKLAPLMDEDILIVASGNVVHNLGAVAWGAGEQGFDWAQRFDDDARTVMQSRPDEISSLRDHDDYRLAVPTPDHFLPLAYLAGIASVRAQRPEVIVDGCTLGSLSMTAYATGV